MCIYAYIYYRLLHIIYISVIYIYTQSVASGEAREENLVAGSTGVGRRVFCMHLVRDDFLCPGFISMDTERTAA